MFLPEYRLFRGIFSGFPQSLPQIKIRHNLLLQRIFQSTLPLSFGGRWPELPEGWLEKLTTKDRTDFLTECIQFKASKIFFYPFISYFYAYVDSVL